MDLGAVLDSLAARGVSELMVEGGPETARGFLEGGMVDRAIIIMAPMTFDQSPVPSGMREATLEGAGLTKIAEHGLWGADKVTLWAKHWVHWPGGGRVEDWP